MNGPIPARARARQADRRPARQCTATRRDGQRCEASTKRRKPGNLTVALCPVHGGS